MHHYHYSFRSWLELVAAAKRTNEEWGNSIHITHMGISNRTHIRALEMSMALFIHIDKHNEWCEHDSQLMHEERKSIIENYGARERSSQQQMHANTWCCCFSGEIRAWPNYTIDGTCVSDWRRRNGRLAIWKRKEKLSTGTCVSALDRIIVPGNIDILLSTFLESYMCGFYWKKIYSFSLAVNKMQGLSL